MTFRATRQGDNIIPPRAGFIAALAASTAAASQDLSLVGNPKEDAPATDADTGIGGPLALSPAQGKGCIEHYANFLADGGDVYVLFGPTAASVTGANAPAPATTGVNAAGVCAKIPSGTTLPVRLVNGLDNFVGYVTASGTATLRIWRSSQ